MGAVESLQALWRNASPFRRGLYCATPVAVVVMAVAAITMASASGGDGDKLAAAPTQAPSPTTVPPTPSVEQVLRYFASILPTATPEPPPSTGGGGGGGGGGTSGGGGSYVPRGGTGPGPAFSTGMSLSIPSIGVNATVNGRTMGTNGHMGDPLGAWDVIWYEFAPVWPGLGGYPGTPGSNAVFAGHVDYIRVGPAVFWSLRDLQPGDQVTVNTPNGPVTYAVQWSVWAGPNDDFTQYVSQTGQDVVTLITCIGTFSAGHYSNRFIVRAVRI